MCIVCLEHVINGTGQKRKRAPSPAPTATMQTDDAGSR